MPILDPDLARELKYIRQRLLNLEVSSQAKNLLFGGEFFSHVSVEHFWTGSGTYVDRTGAFFKVDGDNIINQAVYFEAVMAVEQAGRTAYTKIYNITDGANLTGSEITSTTVGVANPEIVRSGALTFPSGLKVYKLQIKQSPAGNGGDNAHYYAARLVHTQQ